MCCSVQSVWKARNKPSIISFYCASYICEACISQQTIQPILQNHGASQEARHSLTCPILLHFLCIFTRIAYHSQWAFLQKLIQWNSPSSCWKHPWLMAQVTGKACPGLRHTLMGFPLLPLVCYSQSRFCSAVWCIRVKDYIAWILHHYTPNSWAKRGTHLICKTKNLFLV